MVWAFGTAMLLPGAQIEAMAPFPQMAGAAAALMGFLQMGAGVLGSASVSVFANSLHALMIVPVGMAGLSALVFVGLARPTGKGRLPPP
jgi:DHA1 family bicyclomycin/chloramphenicol resistance-like MFS transporter